MGGFDATNLLPLLNTAGLGVIAYMLLVRVERRLSDNEKSINRLVQANMLTLLSSNQTPEPVKKQAQRLLQEINGDTGDDR